MIAASEMVEQFSAVLGVEETQVRTVDRSLKESGLRKVGARRFPPDYTPTEAVRLLLGVAGAKSLVEAAKDVEDLQAFRLVPESIETKSGSKDALPSIIGISVDEMTEMPLVEVLAVVAVHISRHAPKYCGLLVPVGGPVTMQVEADGFTGELQFTGATSHPFAVLTRVAHVHTEALRWIGEVVGGAKD